MEQTPEQKMKGKGILVEEQPEICEVGVSSSGNNQHITSVTQYVDITTVSQLDEDLIDASSDSDSDDDSSSDDLDMDEIPADKKASYKIVTHQEVRRLQEDDVETISNVLSISKAKATVLLILSNWKIDHVTDKWFENPEQFQNVAGLLKIFDVGESSSRKLSCGKCHADVDEYLGVEGFCNHHFCNNCWKDVIGTSVKNYGLVLKCPYVSCDAPVNQNMMSMLASETDQSLYEHIFVRSYLNDNTKGKWCPIPNCDHAVLLDSESNIIPKFTCKCFFTFCYKCLKEAHQPASCLTAEDWRTETLKLSQTYNKLPGEIYSEMSADEGKIKDNAETKNKREQANYAFAKYQNYRTYCDRLDMDQQQALGKLRTMQNQELKTLAEKHGKSRDDVVFITDAWLQAAECKRVFKWAAVCDYYFLEFDLEKRTFYGTLIREAGFVLDELCKAASKLKIFIGTEEHKEKFDDFRERVCFKTSVARNYFENLEAAIKNGSTDLEHLRVLIYSRDSTVEMLVANAGTTDEASKKACPHCNFPGDNLTTKCLMCNH